MKKTRFFSKKTLKTYFFQQNEKVMVVGRFDF